MITFSPKYSPAAQFFSFNYLTEREVDCPDRFPKDLKKRAVRTCRFCKGKAGDANITFKTDSHIFPRALGNRYLISDFECDSCNQKFSKYENDLINYLGITRTINNIEGRNGIPEFVSKDLKASKEIFFDKEDVMKIESNNADSKFVYDAENNIFSKSYTKLPYIPLNVYKALLKMSLCLINESDINKYANAFEFLQSTDSSSAELKSAMLFGFVLPIKYQNIFAVLYKKRDSTINTTSHTFVLFFSDYMFQIFIPFNEDDKKFNNKLFYPILPPMFDGSGDKKWNHIRQIAEDLSDTNPKTDQEFINLGIDKSTLDSLVRIDTLTNTVIDEKFDPNTIAGILIPKNDFKIKIHD